VFVTRPNHFLPFNNNLLGPIALADNIEARLQDLLLSSHQVVIQIVRARLAVHGLDTCRVLRVDDNRINHATTTTQWR